MADKLFPGTSTQYTRLRYVFLAPAMLFKKGASLAGLTQSQAVFNGDMVLANQHENGIIGKRVRERDFVRLYWPAVRTWKLLSPVNDDLRDLTIENGLAAFQTLPRTDEEGGTLDGQRVRWDPCVLKFAELFWKAKLSIKAKEPAWPSIYCTKAESRFIVQRWIDLPDDPALAAMATQVRDGHKVSATKLPWNVPFKKFPQARVDLDRAKAVSLICWAAQLAYNFALIRAAKTLEKGAEPHAWKPGAMDLVETIISGHFREWNDAYLQEQSRLEPWGSPAHWGNLGNSTSRIFLANVAGQLCRGETNLRSSQWAALVKEREGIINPAPKLTFPRHLAAWSGTAEMAKRWDFRWKASVRRFLEDAENPRG